MKNNKNKFYNFITYSCYKYASESFRLFLQGNEILLNYDIKNNLGYIYITKGEKELVKEIKKYIRNFTNISNKQKNALIGIRIKNSSDYIHIGLTVNPYNLEDKLRYFKYIKESLEASNYKNPITTTHAQLNGNYEVIKVEDKTEKLELSNRVCLIY